MFCIQMDMMEALPSIKQTFLYHKYKIEYFGTLSNSGFIVAKGLVLHLIHDPQSTVTFKSMDIEKLNHGIKRSRNARSSV